ncbi:hypothetical protein [Candidatus Similichlamydia epinepheli]|uniref:hypothetical protein n=1 Tax=Candidatus Similichlamydia epinepheli TaxID=1903953 RepID=UPI001EFD2BFF|nr:hypothetical protein [Candidatus Similichlamydia epinepheli]
MIAFPINMILKALGSSSCLRLNILKSARKSDKLSIVVNEQTRNVDRNCVAASRSVRTLVVSICFQNSKIKIVEKATRVPILISIRVA